MVLESLMFPSKAEHRPWELFFLGFLYASLGIILSLWIFKSESSMVMVLLTVVACIPLVYMTFRREEAKDTLIDEERTLLKEHGKALKFLMYLFFGFIIAYALWFIFLPENISSILFKVQTATINQINSRIIGNTINENVLFQIFFNNLRVLFFSILFAFFYGAGAIFILTWNASVIGVFEILAYFVGGLAGGIISVAIINHDINSDKFKNIMKDSLDLILLSIILLVFAALLEVFLTPILFS